MDYKKLSRITDSASEDKRALKEALEEYAKEKYPGIRTLVDVVTDLTGFRAHIFLAESGGFVSVEEMVDYLRQKGFRAKPGHFDYECIVVSEEVCKKRIEAIDNKIKKLQTERSEFEEAMK